MASFEEIIDELFPDYQVVTVRSDWKKSTPEEHEAARRHLEELDRQFEARKAAQQQGRNGFVTAGLTRSCETSSACIRNASWRTTREDGHAGSEARSC